jgi:cell division protein FtsQ
VIVTLLAAATIGGYFAATWPALRPGAIVVSGNRIVTEKEILAKAAIAPEQNMWLQNTNAMAARIETIPYVAQAKIHRRLPAAFFIDVTERVPFAVVRAAGTEAIVDRNLRVLRGGDGVERGLPVLSVGNALSLAPGEFLRDEKVVRLRNDDEMLVNAHIAPDVLSTDPYGELIATLHDGVALLLGDDDDLQKKIPLVDPILAQLERSGRPIAAIDLRAPGTPIVVYKKQ